MLRVLLLDCCLVLALDKLIVLDHKIVEFLNWCDQTFKSFKLFKVHRSSCFEVLFLFLDLLHPLVKFRQLVEAAHDFFESLLILFRIVIRRFLDALILNCLLQSD